MKNPFIIFFSIPLLIGMYLMYQEAFLDIPRSSINSVSKSKNFTLSKRYDSFFKKLSLRLIPYISLSEYRESEYKKALPVLGIKSTPQQYVAELLTKCSVFLALGLLLYFITPLASILLCILSAYIYYSEVRKIRIAYQKRVDEIELELPKFCSVINSRIKSTSNTMQILQSFQPIAGDAMKDELAITINDMRTGSAETALRRFEQRLNSSKISAVVRGLISIQNGDDQSIYFQAKQHQFNNDYFTIRKKEISNRPSKLSMPSVLAVIFFLAIIIYPMSESLSSANIF